MLESQELDPNAVQQRLAAELQQRLAAYLGAPIARLSVLASGWETTVFEFALAARSDTVPAIPVGVPAVLRFYQGGDSGDKGTREHAAIAALARAGYCVPQPYSFEAASTALGAPFMIMQRLAGGPMLTVRSFPQAFKTFSLGFFSFVRAQARLHEYDPVTSGLAGLPPAFPPAPDRADAPLLDRVLAVIAQRVENGPLPGLREGLRRVTERAHLFGPLKPSLVHMDYHPLNVMVEGVRVTGVIDWANADLGDRHLDAAMTAVILSSWALEKPSWMRDNAVGNTLRASFAAMYLPLYHAMAPLELGRFRYCQQVSALLRLSLYGMMRARGPQSVGYRAESLSEITPAAVRALSRYASRKNGTPVHLDAAPEPA